MTQLTEDQMKELVAKEKELEKAELANEVVTKVTSVAEENKKGANIKLPSAEEIITKASLGHIKQKRLFNELFASKQLSVRARQRIMNALLDLPQSDMKSLFKSDIEYETFLVGQTVLNFKFTILTHHIVKAANEAKVSEQSNVGEKTNV